MQNWGNILESFITILYDLEKPRLSNFAGEAIVIRSFPQRFIGLVKKMKPFKMRKKVKILIWHMVGEMVKK